MRWRVLALTILLNGLGATHLGFAQPGAGREPGRIQGKVEEVKPDGFVVARWTGDRVQHVKVYVDGNTSFKFDLRGSGWVTAPFVIKSGDAISVRARVQPDGRAVAETVAVRPGGCPEGPPCPD